MRTESEEQLIDFGGEKLTLNQILQRVNKPQAPSATVDEVERLSEVVHKAYCNNYLARRGKPYWTGGDYSKLDEETKQIDRDTVKAILKALHSQQEKRYTREEVVSIVETSIKDASNGHQLIKIDKDHLTQIIILALDQFDKEGKWKN